MYSSSSARLRPSHEDQASSTTDFFFVFREEGRGFRLRLQASFDQKLSSMDEILSSTVAFIWIISPSRRSSNASIFLTTIDTLIFVGQKNLNIDSKNSKTASFRTLQISLMPLTNGMLELNNGLGMDLKVEGNIPGHCRTFHLTVHSNVVVNRKALEAQLIAGLNIIFKFLLAGTDPWGCIFRFSLLQHLLLHKRFPAPPSALALADWMFLALLWWLQDQLLPNRPWDYTCVTGELPMLAEQWNNKKLRYDRRHPQTLLFLTQRSVKTTSLPKERPFGGKMVYETISHLTVICLVNGNGVKASFATGPYL
ncbi:hypothetical protein M5K25_007278 [Dendrobium thyrsiflorum]|uniref:Uncharacterized protein n=1 Tax=Dendrobium thyrsiflorum TaxID=117978 RepID=A0ABD0VKT3_DENTH